MALDSPSSVTDALAAAAAAEAAEHNIEVRAELDRVSKGVDMPPSLTELCQGINGPWATLPEFRRAKKEFDAEECRFVLDGEVIRIRHTGRTLKQLLGPGSEAILPSDDGEMPAERLAAALLIWARRRLRRQQTRNALVRHARAVTGLARKLKQKTSTMVKPPPAPLPEQRLVIFVGTTRLRFRMRGFLWAPGSHEERIFDKVVFPTTSSDKELMKARKGGASAPQSYFQWDPSFSAAVQTMLLRKKKQPADVINPKARRLVDTVLDANERAVNASAIKLKKITPDGAYIQLPPPPPPLQAVRGGIRQAVADGCSGLHEKQMACKTLTHLVDLRGKIRSVVLAMGASGDGGGDEENPLGACDVLDGIRWQRCGEIGKPLQEAWGFAVAERLYKLWKRLNLSKNGIPYKLYTGEAADRTGVPGLPGVWCPPRATTPARCPGRVDLRAFLGLLMEQKR